MNYRKHCDKNRHCSSCFQRSFCLHCWGFRPFSTACTPNCHHSAHTRVFWGDSTQLGNRTENSVVRGAFGYHVFKGRFDCVVGCFRPFSTTFMLNTPHCSHTHASWVNQPIYAIRRKTVWYNEPLLVMFSTVVLSALYGVLGRFQQHLCPISLTVHKLMGPGRINPAMR